MAGMTVTAPPRRDPYLIAKVMTIIVALAANILFLVMVLNPNVTNEYRNYYIDRTSQSWLKGRRYPEIALNTRIAVDQSILDRAVLGTGWSFPDSGGAWSERDTAYLLFRLPSTVRSDLQLVLSGHPAPKPPGNAQTADLGANGYALGEVTFTGTEDKETTIGIPLSLATGRDGYIALQLRFRDLKSPQALRISNDPRKLGFRLTSLMIRTVPEP